MKIEKSLEDEIEELQDKIDALYTCKSDIEDAIDTCEKYGLQESKEYLKYVLQDLEEEEEQAEEEQAELQEELDKEWEEERDFEENQYWNEKGIK